MKALKRALRKKRESRNTFPLLPDGEITIMSSLDPVMHFQAKLLKIGRKNRKYVIVSLECPECCAPMEWNDRWDAFQCTGSHKALYELV